MLSLPAGREASPAVGAPVYVRHRPERTLLYQLVQEYYSTFKRHLAEQGSILPGYVQREFDDYLQCSRLEHGFLRVRCESCHAEHLVAFSCKRRGLCPSCGARRMAESAALLVDEVLPEQPIRSRPAVSEKRLSLTPSGNVRYPLKTPYRDGTTHVIFDPLDFIARLAALCPSRA